MSSNNPPSCLVAPERWAVHFALMEVGNLGRVIAANITREREARGWSYAELASRCQPKASYQHISRMEKGERGLTPDWIERIAGALGLHPLDLIAGSQEKPDLRLSEQVASEVARVLGTVARDGEEPSLGTVQVLALMLQELTLTFARHPEALNNPAVVRPVTDSLTRRLAHA